jgi:hypothetical protein
MRRIARIIAAASTAAAVWSGQVRAQRLLDWTIHTTAEPEALVQGAAAGFWNPAGIALDSGRIEGLVLDMQGPSSTGLNGAALAAVGRLQEKTSIAVAYQHLGISGIPVTGTSPTEDALGGEISVSEDRFTLAGSQPVSRTTSAGAMLQYLRANDGTTVSTELTFGAGFRFGSDSIRFKPVLAGAGFVASSQTRWIGGAEITPLELHSTPLGVSLGYGISGSGRQTRPTHRGTITLRYAEAIGVTAAVLAEPGSDGTTLQPVLSADLRLGRYALGVLREGLPNSFGAMYSYRLNIRF